MKSVELQLLESLGSGVRPFDPVPPEGPGSGFDFQTALSGALSGRPETELGIRMAPSVSGMFDQSDQLVIARGVDRAAAAGVDQALILHDQRTLRVDVRNRVVLEAEPLDDERVVIDIDGFVVAGNQRMTHEQFDSASRNGQIAAPARVVRNASLVHALAGRVPD